MSSWKERNNLMKQVCTFMNHHHELRVWDLIWAVTAAALGAAFYRAWLSKARFKGNPANWPVFGMLPGVLLHLPDMYDWLASLLINNGGSIRLHGPWLSNMNTFLTADPRNIEHALRTHFNNFPKGKGYSDIFHDLLGKGIFNADDRLWTFQRKTTSLQLNTPSCRQFTDSTVFEMVESKLIPTLQHFCERDLQVDFQDIMLRFTFDTICLVAFGIDTGCLAPELPVVPFAEAFEAALECTTLRFFLPQRWWQVLKWLRLGRERSMPGALKIVNDFSEQVLSSRKEQTKQGLCSNKSDLLTCFLRTGGTLSLDDDKLLKDIAINFLLAGRDTSALALSWFFWLLATNPDVEKKAAEEAQRVIECAATKEDGKPILTRTELSRMHYLHAALTEALRLYPSVPIDVKHVMKDDILPDGNRLRKGDTFAYHIYAMGRMESLWGPDCRSFRPERWLHPQNGTFTDSKVRPFHYLAFNAGPRTCLGKDMAYLLMKTVASAILFHFRVVLVPGHEVLPKLSTTLYMKNGLLVTLEPRKKP